jgi:uncharacterized membrane protein
MNSNEFSILILLLSVDAIVMAVLILMPVLRREHAFFGVRVSREIYEGEGRRILHRYWLCLIASFVALGAIGVLTAYYRRNFIYAVVSYLVTYPVAFALYANFAREVRPFRIVNDAKKFATSLRTRRLADYTTVVLEALIVVLAITPFVVLVYYYPAIPERVPVHWGFNGMPDRWARKTFSTVFFLPVLALYLQSWFLLLKYDLVHAKMTLPADQAEVYLAAKEKLIVTSTNMMDWLRALGAGLLGLVSMFVLFTTIESLRHWMPIANLLIWPFVGLLLIVVFYYLYRFMTINNSLEEATGNSNVQRESEAEKWSGGGLFYYNPDDPALIVEKRDGLGFTYNFAGKGIRLRLAFLALVPVIVIWALLDL